MCVCVYVAGGFRLPAVLWVDEIRRGEGGIYIDMCIAGVFYLPYRFTAKSF